MSLSIPFCLSFGGQESSDRSAIPWTRIRRLIRDRSRAVDGVHGVAEGEAPVHDGVFDRVGLVVVGAEVDQEGLLVGCKEGGKGK